MTEQKEFTFPNKYEYFILPGLGNSDSNHWQTQWENKFQWKRVDFKEWDNPNFADWKLILDQRINESKKPIVIVAHSLACILVAHLMEEKYTSRIAAAILVAPADIENKAGLPKSIESFTPIPLENLPFPSLVIYSENDPYAAVERSFYFCLSWRSFAHTVGEEGHINSDSNLGAWEEGQKMMYEWMKQIKIL